MKKISLLFILFLLMFTGCGKKKGTLDDQAQTASGPVLDTVKQEAPAVTQTAAEEKSMEQEAEHALRPIYFEFDAYILSSDSRNTLSRIAAFMKKYPNVRLKTEGHCDERGSSEYNMALGQKRADEAKKYICAFGIKKSRISTMSWGEEKPAVPGNTEEAWAKNRRDEFDYEK